MAIGDRIARQRGITSSPLLGSERTILLFRGSVQRFPISFFPTGNLEGKMQLTNRLGETEAETGCQDFGRPPWPPPAPLPDPESRLFGEQWQQEHTQAGRGHWHLALGQALERDFCRSLGGDVSWRNFTQVRNDPVSRGLDPKNKEAAIFYLTLTEWKTI